MNGDGWPDVVAGDPNQGLVLLLNTARVPPSVPGAPTLTSAAPGDGQVALSWTRPSTDGGSPITGYTATAGPAGATCTTTGLGCSITGLANGTTYSFTVTASNAIGAGSVSNTVTATPGVPPSAPASLTTSPNLAAGVGLAWQPPSNPGTSAVTGYRIYRSTVAGDTPILLATVGNVLGYTDTAVSNGGQYAYRVAALNAFGEGARSAEARTQRGTAPSAPQTPTASAGGAGITVKWSPPASNGGSSVTAYRIYRGTTSGAGMLLATVGPTTTGYLDKAVARKTRYVYSVSAVNVLGEGARSGEAWATAR